MARDAGVEETGTARAKAREEEDKEDEEDEEDEGCMFDVSEDVGNCNDVFEIFGREGFV